MNDLAEEDSDKFKASEAKVEVGFEGSFGQLHVSPRGLRSSCLRSLVCVEGIVTKVRTNFNCVSSEWRVKSNPLPSHPASAPRLDPR